MKAPASVLLTLAITLAAVISPILPRRADAPLAANSVAAAAGAEPAAAVDIRVNAGGPSYADSQGRVWLADQAYAPASWGYIGGTPYSTGGTVYGTSDQPLYQSQRSLPVAYLFDVPNDTYEVQLRFAEIYCTTDCRSFNVKIEGAQVLSNFGPFKTAGYSRALDATYVVPVTDNQLRVEFVAGVGTPIINAIHVTGTAGGPPRNEIRVNGGSFDYIDSEGKTWFADQRFLSGAYGYGGTADTNVARVATAIANTNEQALLQTNRYGQAGSTLGYTFTMPNGLYKVDLLFAELYVSVNAAGARVFDVWANGTRVIANMDVFAESGNRYRAISETLSMMVTDSQLAITFTQKTANPPIINAIAVQPLDLVAPEGWANFAPAGWATSRTPAVSVQVQDSGAGLDVRSGLYAYSSDGGASFSDWTPAATSGARGTITPQRITAPAVPFNQDSSTQSRVKFRISDIAGNWADSPVYTVPTDSTPPASVIATPATGVITSGLTIQIQGSASDSVSGVQLVDVSTDGGSTWSAASGTTAWTYTFNAPADGDYAIRSRARDEAGLTEVPAPGIDLRMDATPPVSAILAPGSGAVVTTATHIISGTASDAIGVQSVQVSTNGGLTWSQANGTTNWSFGWNIPADGVYYLLSRARDVSGWIETPRPAVTVTLDTMPPATLIRAPSNGQLVGASVVITGTAFDAASGVRRVELSFDSGGSWVTATGTTAWSYTWLPSGQGEYFIRARAVDRAGWVDTPGTAVRVRVDRVAPTSTITDPAGGQAISGTTYLVRGVAADDAAGSGLAAVEFSFDGLAWNAVTGLGQWTYSWNTLPADGIYTIRSRARDVAGNLQTTPYQVDVAVDNMAPAATASVVGTLGGGGWYLSPVTVSLAGVDPTSGVAGIYYRLDNGHWKTYLQPVAITSNGRHTLDYYAVDNAGNSGKPHSVNPNVDTVAPESIAHPGGSIGNGGWYRTPVIVDIASGDNASGVRAVATRLDNGAWLTYSAPFTITGDGLHTLQFQALDVAGNREITQSVALGIDMLAPAVTMTAPIADQSVRPGPLLIQGSAGDGAGSGGALVEISIDGAAWASVSGTAAWNYTWTPPAPGRHNLRLRATDNTGNVSTPGPGISIIMDDVAPQSAITSPQNEQILPGHSAVISGTSTDTYSSVAAVEVSTDSGHTWSAATLLSSGAWTFHWTFSGEGTFNLRSRATDRAGNVESAGPGIAVQVDSVSPSSSISAPADGQLLRGVFLTISGAAGDTGSGVKRVEVSIDSGPWQAAGGTTAWSYGWSPASDGQHTIRSRALDNAGNVETAGEGVAVTVDNTRPSSSIAQPRNGQIVTAPSLVISGESLDALSGVDHVNLSIRRNVDGFYWNGASWTAGETWLATSGAPAWSYVWTSLPQVGSFTIQSRATDIAGNTEVAGAGASVVLRRGYAISLPVIAVEQ